MSESIPKTLTPAPASFDRQKHVRYVWYSWFMRSAYWARSCWEGDTTEAAIRFRERLESYDNVLVEETTTYRAVSTIAKADKSELITPHLTPKAEHTPEPEAPRAFYACTSCNREENCHVAEEMYWSVSETKWVCEICWDEKEEALGVRLSDHLKAQPLSGIADPSAVQEAIEALEVIAKASKRSETMFGGPMSDVTRVFENITRVSTAALAKLGGKA